MNFWKKALNSDEPKSNRSEIKHHKKRTWSETIRNPRLSNIRWPKIWSDPDPNDSRPGMIWANKNLKLDPIWLEMIWNLKKPDKIWSGSGRPEPDAWPDNFFWSNLSDPTRPNPNRTRPSSAVRGTRLLRLSAKAQQD
jgi:hypothetical protein